MKNSGRHIAFTVLLDFEKNPKSIEPILKQALTATKPEQREINLAYTLINGVLQYKLFLEAIIDHYSSTPLPKLHPVVIVGLRLGLYQLLFLNRIPDHAAINETILFINNKKLPKKFAQYTNGVLRTIGRERTKATFPPPMHPYQRCNIPLWLYKRWHKRYGKEYMAGLCLTINNRPALTLNTLGKTNQKYPHGLPGKYAPNALHLPDHSQPLSSLAGFDCGDFIVQDQGAKLICQLLPTEEHKNYLDGCAGLGGKTIAWATRIPSSTTLTAIDPNTERFALLQENLHRLNLQQTVTISKTNLEEFGHQKHQLFDAILLDVPCSGLGTLRRHPEIRWIRQEKELCSYQEKQLALLTSAVQLLSPEGILVYATCSTELEENEEVINAFLVQHNNFTVENAKDYLPAEAASLVTSNGFFETRPGAEDIDGFFAVRLKRYDRRPHSVA